MQFDALYVPKRILEGQRGIKSSILRIAQNFFVVVYCRHTKCHEREAMEITFLGTGAYDYAKELKTTHVQAFHPDYRRSSSILIDGTLLIDCGDHTINSMNIAGIDKRKIGSLLITHTHIDHCRLENIALLAEEAQGLQIWCHQSVAGYLEGLSRCTVHPLEVGEKQPAGGAEITALYANHRTKRMDERPVHYIIEKDHKKLFYGCDGAWFYTDTFYALLHQEFDLFVFDCTMGDYDGDYRIAEHNSIPMVRMLIKSMEKAEVFSGSCQIYLSHLAPSLHAPHKETAEKLAKEDLLVAYDGLKISI